MPDATGSGPLAPACGRRDTDRVRRTPRAHAVPRPAVAACRSALLGLIAAAVALAGCGARHAAASAASINVISAYVMQADGVKTVDAYFVLANTGTSDRLVSVRSSAGGKVIMLTPAAPGVSVARATTDLVFPGHAVTKLDPTGMHLEIVGSGPLHQGTDITLTLVFAHDGKLKVSAQVSNPQTGNSSYFGP